MFSDGQAELEVKKVQHTGGLSLPGVVLPKVLKLGHAGKCVYLKRNPSAFTHTRTRFTCNNEIRPLTHKLKGPNYVLLY